MVGDYGVTGAAVSSILTGAIVLSVGFVGLWRKLRFSTADLKRGGYDFSWFRICVVASIPIPKTFTFHSSGYSSP